MTGLSEALLAELQERFREATDAQQTDPIQDVIDALDEALGETVASGALYGQGVRRLRRWCRTSGRVPSSCTLADAVELDSAHALSSSALSDVYAGHSRGTKVAVKALRLHVDGRKSVQKSFRNEVVTWKCLRHPNVVPFLGISDRFPVCLVSEWMPGGTISAFLVEHPEENRSRYIQQVVRGLEFMHALGVIHGDLKPSNILVDEQGNARLADFGMVTVLFNSSTQATTVTGEGVGGTMRYMAPELHAASAAGSDGPTLSVTSDVYALAMTLWELFSGQLPFSHIRADHAVLLQVLAGKRPLKPSASPDIGLTDSVWDLMERGWVADPLSRPALSEFLAAVAPDVLRVRELAVASMEEKLRSLDAALAERQNALDAFELSLRRRAVAVSGEAEDTHRREAAVATIERKLAQKEQELAVRERELVMRDQAAERAETTTQPAEPRRTQDMVHRLTLSLEDLYKGTATKIDLTRKDICTACDGTGGKKGAVCLCGSCSSYAVRARFHQKDTTMPRQLRDICDNCGSIGQVLNNEDMCKTCDGRTVITGRISLLARIDKGTRPGHIIKFAGESDRAPGALPGDIIVEVVESPHKRFRRQDGDLFTEVEVDLLSALGGGQFKLRHLDDRVLVVNIGLSTVLKTRDVKVIRRQGMLAPGSQESGDMFVKLSVKFPERVDPALALQLDAILPPRAPAKEFPHIIRFEDVEVEDLNADQRMRYEELGEVSRAQAARFQRHQSDLLTDVEVDLLSALGGGQLRIRHLDDRRVLVVNIAPGTVIRTGDVRVIRGQGVLAPVSGERGDMFVKLSVKFPERVDPALALQLDAILPPRAPAKEFPHIIKFEDVEVEDLNADQRMRYKELGKISRAQGARFRRHQSDLLADVEVDLLSALGGGQLRIRHLDDRRVLVVNIPPGTVIRTGDVKVIHGQGALAAVSGERGDMFVKLSVKFPERVDPALVPQLDAILPPRAPAKEFPHIIKFEDVEVEDLNADQRMRYDELGEVSRAQAAHFRRQKNDLLTEVELDLLSALGGGQLRIRHLDDRRVLAVNIAPGSVIRTGDVKVIRGQGALAAVSGERGDMFVKLSVKFPERVDPALLPKLAGILRPRTPAREFPHVTKFEDVKVEDLDAHQRARYEASGEIPSAQP